MIAGRAFSFEVNRTTTAPPHVVFALVVDGANWSNWAKPLVLGSRMLRHGDPPPGGIGAVRVLGTWPVLMRERTVEHEQDRKHSYVLENSGAPLRNYRADLVLTPTESGGTRLHWQGSFTERFRGTGPLVRLGFKGIVTFIAARLTRAAERNAAG
ncbi:SRPBCC family protein [Saccharomonospora sp. NPDC006951]